MESKIFGYCRCSTNESKQDVKYQIDALIDKGVDISNIRYEYISGRKEHRPGLDALFEEMNEGDTLIVTDITRLCRNTKVLCEIIDLIIAKRFRLIVGTIDIDCRTGALDPMIEGMLKVNAVFGEMEAKLKVHQIKLGLATAVKDGKKLGRPKSTYDDGDPMDILVIMEQPTFPGCIIEARPIGIMGMIDSGDKDYKVLAVPAEDPRFDDVNDIDDVPAHLLKEIEHFFSVYKNLQGKEVETLGWEDAKAAKAEIERSLEMYKEQYE